MITAAQDKLLGGEMDHAGQLYCVDGDDWPGRQTGASAANERGTPPDPGKGAGGGGEGGPAWAEMKEQPFWEQLAISN